MAWSLSQSCFCVLQHDLIGPWINLRQRIAFLNNLAFFVEHLHQVSGDLAFYRYGINRGDSTQPGKIDADVTFAGLGGNHRDRAEIPCRPLPGAVTLAACDATIPFRTRYAP